MRTPLRAIALALLLGGCAIANGQPENAAPSPGTDQVITGDLTGQQQQKRLVIRITLSHPSDLLISESEVVTEGQVLADRVNDRERLQVQLEKVLLQIAQVSQPVTPPPPMRPVPELAGLPPTSFLDEAAAVERAVVVVESHRRRVENQQRLLDMLSNQPVENLPQAVIPHETVVLDQLRQELAQAEADHQLEIAQMQQAQAEQQFQEYEHSVRISNRQLQMQQAELQRSEQVGRLQEAERDRQFKLSQLEATRGQLETQLFSLSAIRAPFAGTIQRISWEGQNDQALIVELTLISGSGGNGGGDRPSSDSPD